MENKDFLIRAVNLAEDGIKKGGGPFCTVIVFNGEIISEAINRTVSSNDPTTYAEKIFKKLKEVDGIEVFGKWNRFENNIPY